MAGEVGCFVAKGNLDIVWRTTGKQWVFLRKDEGACKMKECERHDGNIYSCSPQAREG